MFRILKSSRFSLASLALLFLGVGLLLQGANYSAAAEDEIIIRAFSVTPSDFVVAGEPITVRWSATGVSDSNPLFLVVTIHDRLSSTPISLRIGASGEQTIETTSSNIQLDSIDVDLALDDTLFSHNAIASTRVNVHCRYLWFMLPPYESPEPPSNSPLRGCPGRPLVSQATQQNYENGFVLSINASGEELSIITNDANSLGQPIGEPVVFETVKQTSIDPGQPYYRLADGTTFPDEGYDGYANPHDGFRPNLTDTPPSSQTPNDGSGDCIIPPSGHWPPCATGGNMNQPSDPTCVIPPSGPWPPCATGGTNQQNCVIPPSGPWPPCAIGGPIIQPTDPACVIPPSGPWPPCATGG